MSMLGTVFLLLLLAVTRFEATAAIPAGIEDSDGYGKQRETPFLHRPFLAQMGHAKSGNAEKQLFKQGKSEGLKVKIEPFYT